jgi:hypothetical protein
MTQFVAASRFVQQATRATGGDTRSPDNTEIPGRFRGNVENRDNRRVATPLAMDGHQPVEPVFLIGIEIHRSNERRLLELAVQSLADANRLEVRAVPGRARSCLPLPPTPVESQWLLNSDSAIRREIPLDGVTRRAVEVASTVNASPRAPVLSVVPARVAGENRLPVRYRGLGRTLRFSIMGRAVFSKVGNQAVDH